MAVTTLETEYLPDRTLKVGLDDGDRYASITLSEAETRSLINALERMEGYLVEHS